MNTFLSIVDGGDNCGGELLEQVCEAVFLGGGFASASTTLSLSSNAAIGIKTTKRAIAFLKNASSLLDERLDIVDQFLFVKLLLRSTISSLNVLEILLAWIRVFPNYFHLHQ